MPVPVPQGASPPASEPDEPTTYEIVCDLATDLTPLEAVSLIIELANRIKSEGCSDGE